jgi:glycine/D-amino acid oxidase-like deaminating enzyme
MGDPSASATDFDAVIVGGGIAGLWLLRRLRDSGYRAVLLSATPLGCGQTLASQGIIHGGLKYALAGQLTRASEQIADMPARWSACLEGRGEIDLRALAPVRQSCHLFAAAGTLGRLTSFLASRSLRGRVEALARSEFPAGLLDPAFNGSVHRLVDFVLPMPALLRTLVAPVTDSAYTADALAALNDSSLSEGGVRLELAGSAITARHLILAAGSGNAALLARLGLGYPRMQRRPLAQVIVRAPDLPPLFAHCLTGIRRPEPRLTITSHADEDSTLWYLGGQIATDGVGMDRNALVAHARRELRACLPWRDWSRADIETLAIDRAEPLHSNGKRPDEAFATGTGPGGRCIVVWPTKLSLAPDLGDRVLRLLAPGQTQRQASDTEPTTPRNETREQPRLALPGTTVGAPPWSRNDPMQDARPAHRDGI